MKSLHDKLVCITGASSGIGKACAEKFAGLGCNLLLVARRKDRIDDLAAKCRNEYEIKTHTLVLDVRQNLEVAYAFSSLPEKWKAIDILINNAGLARGFAKLHEGDVSKWDEMIDTNVKGLLYVTRAVLPLMIRRNEGHIINIGSIAGHQTYPMGNVYSATKFAVVAITRSLQMELLGTCVRTSSVDPGLVETEFSKVRYDGDSVRASKTYEGMTPLGPGDVAEAVVFCATRPPHVNIGEMTITPADQATVTMVHRQPADAK